jgi:hypothetical protein
LALGETSHYAGGAKLSSRNDVAAHNYASARSDINNAIKYLKISHKSTGPVFICGLSMTERREEPLILKRNPD